MWACLIETERETERERERERDLRRQADPVIRDDVSVRSMQLLARTCREAYAYAYACTHTHAHTRAHTHTHARMLRLSICRVPTYYIIYVI